MGAVAAELAPCEPIACHCPVLLLICFGFRGNRGVATGGGPLQPLAGKGGTAGAPVIDKPIFSPPIHPPTHLHQAGSASSCSSLRLRSSRISATEFHVYSYYVACSLLISWTNTGTGTQCTGRTLLPDHASTIHPVLSWLPCSCTRGSGLPPRLRVTARLRHELGLRFGRPLPKYGAPYPYLAAPHDDGAFVVLAHAHAQLQLMRQPQFLGHEIPLLRQQPEVLVLILGRRLHAPGDGADCHEAQQVEVGAVVDDGPAE